MTHKSYNFPKEIYHRIHWYAKRNVDPQTIANTLKIPLKAVKTFLEKLSLEEQNFEKKNFQTNIKAQSSFKKDEIKDFLDIFRYEKTRYAVIDIGGMLTEKNIEKLNQELTKLLTTNFKAIALKMSDVMMIDEKGFNAICAFCEAFSKTNRFAAILDPSLEVEKFLEKFGQQSKIYIFGTESAFEQKAFG
jgi:anti-anti-sigma regulatory factor